jgi:hypothetical protein
MGSIPKFTAELTLRESEYYNRSHRSRSRSGYTSHAKIILQRGAVCDAAISCMSTATLHEDWDTWKYCHGLAQRWC